MAVDTEPRDNALARVARVVGLDRALLLLSIVGGLLFWQTIAQNYSSVIMAPPLDVLSALVTLLEEGELIPAAIGSLHQYFAGFFLAIAIAVPLGFAMGQSQTVRWALNPYIDAVYATPVVAYLPLIIAWFGLQFNARVFFVFVFCFFEILIDTQQGVTEVLDEFRDVGVSFDATWLDQQRKIVFPASLPFIFSGIRLSAGRGIRGMITAEIFLALVNLGKILEDAAAQLQTQKTLAVIVVIIFLGLSTQYIVQYIEHKALPWHFAAEDR